MTTTVRSNLISQERATSAEKPPDRQKEGINTLSLCVPVYLARFVRRVANRGDATPASGPPGKTVRRRRQLDCELQREEVVEVTGEREHVRGLFDDANV